MQCDSVCGCCKPCNTCRAPKESKLCSGARSGRSLSKHKSYTPPKHSCFDPEELPGGSKFASLKGLPPPPCYSCGQNAKPRQKPERSGSPATKSHRRADKAAGPGESQGPGGSGGGGGKRGGSGKRRRSSGGHGSGRGSTASAKRSGEKRGSGRHGSERHGSERHGSERRSSKSPSTRASGGELPESYEVDEAGRPVERTPSGRMVPITGARRPDGTKRSGMQGVGSGSHEGSPGIWKSGSAEEGAGYSPDGVAIRSSMAKRLGPGQEGNVVVTKSGTTFAVDEYGRVIPMSSSSPAGHGLGDFLQMMSFLVGLAAGYGLSSVLCRLTRCKILNIIRNLRDVGTFLISERCSGP